MQWNMNKNTLIKNKASYHAISFVLIGPHQWLNLNFQYML